MHKNLIEWAQAYIKYKDVIHKKIKSLKIEGEKIIISKKDGSSEIYLCHDDLNSLNVSIVKDEKVVCLNTKGNLDWLIKKWGVVKMSRTIFIFANINLSQSWAIHPSMHDAITEKSALKLGFKSLFSSVPRVK